MKYIYNYSGMRVCSSILVVLFSFFAFSSHVFGKDTRLRQILEDLEVGPIEKQKIALNTCSGDRIYKCYHLMISLLKDPQILIVDDALQIQNTVAIALIKLRLNKAIVKKSIEPLKEAVQMMSKKIEEQKAVIQKIKKRPMRVADFLREEKTLEKMYEAKSNMIRALGSFRQPKLISYLIPFLKDQNKLVRLTAALCLSYLPDRKNQKMLENHLTNEKEEIVRLELIRALLAIDKFNYEYIDLFLKMFFSKNRAVRKEAAKVGAQFQIREGRGIIEEVIALEIRDDVSLEMKKYRNSVLFR